MAETRRTVLKILSGALGGGAAAAVGVPAVVAVVAPVTRDTVSGGGEVDVMAADAVPDDGAPVSVPVVIEEPKDAWNALPPTQVGAVFLRRDGGRIRAFSTICPHLGCGIDYAADKKLFKCPCHNSYFTPDGSVSSGPSPRGMDELETKVEGGRVLVRFQKFKIGVHEKVPA